MDSEKAAYTGPTGTLFDQTETWERECRPILDELIQKCRLYRIPFFWTACTSNTPCGTTYRRDCAGPAGMGLALKDDQISRHLAVSRGFLTVPPSTGDTVLDSESDAMLSEEQPPEEEEADIQDDEDLL